jgi:hypothetical protein
VHDVFEDLEDDDLPSPLPAEQSASAPAEGTVADDATDAAQP